MSSVFPTRFTTVARSLAPGSALSLPAAFAEQLTSLYGLVQRSSYVFGSPLGAVAHAGRSHPLPRFVYFGPHASEASVRLAFLAGFDHRDLRGTLALLHFIEGLALEPEIGHGLNFSLFPLVDVLGSAGAGGPRARPRKLDPHRGTRARPAREGRAAARLSRFCTAGNDRR